MERRQKIAIDTINRLREASGMTQLALAEKANITNSHLNKILRGKKPLGRAAATAIANVFGIEVDALYFGEPLPEIGPTFRDALVVLQAFETAIPLRRACALALLTGQSSYLEPFSESFPLLLEVLKTIESP